MTSASGKNAGLLYRIVVCVGSQDRKTEINEFIRNMVKSESFHKTKNTFCREFFLKLRMTILF